MKILVADDESIIRMGLKTLLEGMGHSVIACRDGHEALEKAQIYRPDLAILDIRMPRTNGLQTAQAINRHMPMPIIFLTAYSQDDLIEKATDLFVQGYLIKPIKPEELRAAIAVAVKRFNDVREEQERRQALEAKLETRRLLDRAKGILMDTGLSEQEAHSHIQQLARDSRLSVRQVAEKILQGL